MMELFTNVGIFLYPLAACSLIAATITLERLWALRQSRVLPVHMLEAFVAGRVDTLPADLQSVSGRIVTFYRERRPDAEALNAYARLEVSRMERGVFLLEFVIGAAPLLGLLGTVIGLTQVFGGFSADVLSLFPSSAKLAVTFPIAKVLAPSLIKSLLFIPVPRNNQLKNRL